MAYPLIGLIRTMKTKRYHLSSARLLLKAPILVLLTQLVVVMLPEASFAGGAEEQAAAVFERRFKARDIQGTGHLFRIVVECDQPRLQTVSAGLRKGETRVVEYQFTFVQHTRDKRKARIEGSGLAPAVDRCIIDRYYAEVTFMSGPWVPEEIPSPTRFPALIAPGRPPLVPVTPIGFVGEEPPAHGER